MYEEIGGLHNVSWHVHGRLVHGLLYFHAYSKLPCTVQQFTTLFGLARFLVLLPYVHDTWYLNGNNKKPHFGGYSNRFYIPCIAMYLEVDFLLLKHLVTTKITPQENIDPRNLTSSQSTKIYTMKFSTRTVYHTHLYN